MATSLQFSELINSIYGICDNPIPEKLFNRYRCEYECILSQVCLGKERNIEINISYLLQHLKLGSQPTLLRRLNELEDLRLIKHKENADKRSRSFELTERGEDFLEKCSALVLSIARATT